MCLRGIHYDVGILTIEGVSTRPTLTADEIEHDIDDIANGRTRTLSGSLVTTSHVWSLPVQWLRATDLRCGSRR